MERVAIDFVARGAEPGRTLVLVTDDTLAVAGPHAERIAQAARAAHFKGKIAALLDVLAPSADLDRLIVLGQGKPGPLGPKDALRLGGVLAGKLAQAGREGVVLADIHAEPGAAAALAFGYRLGAYSFDRYKTRKDDNGERKAPDLAVSTSDPAAAHAAFEAWKSVAAGVELARDLVNAPPNELGPVEFAEACLRLGDVGIEVEVLTEREMAELGMRALLGVGQGSARGSRLVVMRHRGGGAGKPLAVVGKGVTFDTGGISIKPAANMEDMKGDMAGAAAVVGLMRALGGRKAPCDVVGVVGLVENMPDGAAQRPGDIVRSMSGQTIEIINTDAEGRLVLADALHYTRTRFEPEAIINLATLTGAIIVALGHDHAGLFSNDDDLARALTAAGEASGEKLWRLPLGPEYDKLIDSKVADMKNAAGRSAGSITAAQFLKRFVGDTPWAHLDIAGAGMGVPASDLNRSWAPGFGVRLLDQFVRDRAAVRPSPLEGQAP